MRCFLIFNNTPLDYVPSAICRRGIMQMWLLVCVYRCFCVVGGEETQVIHGTIAQLQRERELAELGRNLGVAAARLGDLECDLSLRS